MKIAIITDGNNTLGMGHIYQSRTLAEFLSIKTNNQAEIFFITKSNENVIDLLKTTGKKVYQYGDDNLILAALKTEKPDRVIFDKLDVSPDLAKKIKEELQTKLIIFTNLTEANNFADIAVLADIGSNFKNIVNKDTITGKMQYFGPKFWILRPEFYNFKTKKKIQNDVIKNIMLIFGGADPSNISSFVLDELLQIDSEFNILLVLGSAFEHNKELNEVLEKNKASKSNVNIVKNMTNVSETMYKSDVVFASPGLSFFEALAVGTPVIGFHQNELQMKVYADILPTMGIEDIHKLASMIKNKSFLFPVNPIIASMEIGEGKDEIIAEILN
ncbi:MAG: hypothetical protein Q7W13_06180 [Bacteroidia bacterium]|nr:hypothetical protein [Bacteroidia bacterium]